MSSRTERWLIGAISNTEHRDGTCVGVACVHIENGVPYEVDRISLSGTLSARDIAMRFDEKLIEYCQDMAGMQTCWLFAFYGANQEPGTKLLVTINGRTTYEQHGVTEPPTATGLLQQSMREKEAHLKLYIDSQATMVNGWRQLAEAQALMVSRTASENATLRVELAEGYNIIKSMSGEVRNDLFERELLARKEQKNSEIQATLLKWAPSIINTILGKKVFTEAAEDSAIISGLVEHMSEEHIQTFIAMLPPGAEHAAALLSTRAKELIDRRNKLLAQANDVSRLLGAGNPQGELQ